jgi:hypothetical protein
MLILFFEKPSKFGMVQPTDIVINAVGTGMVSNIVYNCMTADDPMDLRVQPYPAD